MSTPHRVVDQALDGVAESAKGIVNGVIGGIQGIGEEIMRGIDKPLQSVTGKIGPHRIIDGPLDGYGNALKTAVNQGMIGALQQLGEGIATGLDNPPRQIGIPPALGNGDFLPPPPFDMPSYGRW